jgi:membrane-associated protein
MKRSISLLLGFGVAYSLLFILSILVIVPRYLSGGLGGFFLALLTDTEPEIRPGTSLLSVLAWILIPLTSIVLCVLSWLAYDFSSRSTGLLRKLGLSGGVLFFSAGFIPAILVVRELLASRVFGVTLPGVMHVLTRIVLAMRGVMMPAELLGRGTWVIPVIIFVETGLFFGFFLPGDSLLLTVGVLGSAGHVDLTWLIPLTVLSAIVGDQLGYVIGRRSGEALSARYGFVHENLERASDFFSKYGGKAVALARFVPVLRTFAPVLAGAAKMNYLRFTLSNIVGGTLWVLSVTIAGYFVGSQVPSLVHYLDPLLLVIILSSPLVWFLAWIWGRAKKVS